MAVYTMGDLSAEVYVGNSRFGLPVSFIRIASCNEMFLARGWIIVGLEFCVGCTLALRVFAMYGFNKPVIFSLGSAAIVTAVLGAWSVVPVGPTPVIHTTVPGCHSPQQKTQYIRKGDVSPFRHE
ncbi:hypothetical protein B0H10DRAFT_1963724 [Mycena sp. CBHHK59/15]|nr:hypothetical protein B0H10DRAFT_1963724 [Mycena sp. CBHHK59/15]